MLLSYSDAARSSFLSKLAWFTYPNSMLNEDPSRLSRWYRLSSFAPGSCSLQSQSFCFCLFTSPSSTGTLAHTLLWFGSHADVYHRTLYLLFAAFPIVFQVHRGWSEGVGGLAFLGKFLQDIASIQALILSSRCCIWHVRRYRLLSILTQMVYGSGS